MTLLNKLLLTTSLALAAGTASAAQLVALDANDMLYMIDTETLSVTGSMQVTGASNLRGIDVRPATGALYALSAATQLVTIDASTGAATAVAEMQVALPGSGQVLRIPLPAGAHRVAVPGMSAPLDVEVRNGRPTLVHLAILPGRTYSRIYPL